MLVRDNPRQPGKMLWCCVVCLSVWNSTLRRFFVLYRWGQRERECRPQHHHNKRRRRVGGTGWDGSSEGQRRGKRRPHHNKRRRRGVGGTGWDGSSVVDVAVSGSFRRRWTRGRGIINVGGSIIRCRLLRRPGPSPSIPLSVVDGAKDPADHKGNNARCVNLLSICLAQLSIYCVVCLSCTFDNIT